MGRAGKTGGQPSEHLHLRLTWNGSARSWHEMALDGYVVHSVIDANNADNGLNYQGTLNKGNATLSDPYSYKCRCIQRQGMRWEGSGTVEAGDGQNVPSNNVRCSGEECSWRAILFWNAHWDRSNDEGDPGFRYRIAPGAYNINDGAFDNKASSVQVSSGWSVMLYADPFAEVTRCLDRDAVDLAELGNFPGTQLAINDQVLRFRFLTMHDAWDPIPAQSWDPFSILLSILVSDAWVRR